MAGLWWRRRRSVVNVAALPLVSDPMSFFTRTLPYILGTRDYFNSSILGNGVYF